MAKVLRGSIFFAVLLACSTSVRADPLLMFLFSVAKEVVGSAASRYANSVRKQVEVPSTMYPGTTVEPAVLHRLIQDSFLYLSEDRRDEIFEALNAELLKPANAAIRAPLIEHFAERALQVRAAQLRLAQLSTDQKKVLAQEFRQEVKDLPEEDLGPLRKAVESGLLPVPADLNQL